MKPITTITLFGALVLGSTFSSAQEPSNAQPQKPTQVRYAVRDLGPVGGPPGQPVSVTGSGLISGAAAMPDSTEHAILWYKGLEADIGIPGLGGLNSVAFGANDRVQAVGKAETSTPDPNGEDFCGFSALGHASSGSTCVPFMWQNGVMTPLPTLGGNNGAANQINNRGEAAGVAENARPDTDCPAPQVLQFKPVIWKKGAIKELRTVTGDPDGIAFAVNDNGQVVGGSGVCAPFNPQLYVNLDPLHELLRVAVPYELGAPRSSFFGFFGAFYPVYTRGEAYLAARQGTEAAAEFQKILNHRGIVVSDPVGALARLQLARAFALSGDTAKAKSAYQDFLTLWKDADPDIPVLKQAKAEFAKLQ